jgi:hypothetical protein
MMFAFAQRICLRATLFGRQITRLAGHELDDVREKRVLKKVLVERG